MNKVNNIMVDCETLGTTADAVIMSIGAVRFSMDGTVKPNGFYASVSVDSNTALGRRIDEATLTWWMDQSPEARKVFAEPKMTLPAALEELLDFVEPDDLVWSNGASFDIPMLEHAYRQCDITPPWKFYNSRCMRTYRALPGADRVARSPVSHNALQDAFDQAKYLQAIYAEVFGRQKETA